MAYVKFKDGRRQMIPDPIAARIWLGMHGHQDMDEDQEQFAQRIDSIMLSDYMSAPDEYIRRNLMQIIPKVLNTWLVDVHGRPCRPQSREGYIFAEKWGLWSKGKPTALIIDPEQQMMLI